MSDTISFEVHINKPYDEAVEIVTSALKAEGFGVLTRIDVKATMKEKLGEDFHPYVILGACNPPLAHRALSADASIGLLLPCNITVEAGTEDDALVRFLDPHIMMEVGEFRNAQNIREVAQAASAKLKQVAESLKN